MGCISVMSTQSASEPAVHKFECWRRHLVVGRHLITLSKLFTHNCSGQLKAFHSFEFDRLAPASTECCMVAGCLIAL